MTPLSHLIVALAVIANIWGKPDEKMALAQLVIDAKGRP